MSRGAKPVRLDTLLVRRGLAPSRARARELIAEGQVEVDRRVAHKPAAQVRPDREVRLVRPGQEWVSRGARKLLSVLDPMQVDPSGRVCADLGASTGGFTEVLLERGATRVYALDVGRGQLAWKLRHDPRVIVMEGVNVRHLDGLPEPISLVVGDLSFISLAYVLPVVRRILTPGGDALLLVKPQFEVGPRAVAKGGRVLDADARQAAIERVREAAHADGFDVKRGMDSPLPGARAGNVEHFLLLRAPAEQQHGTPC